MGPYCNFCNLRCFVPIPEGAPATVIAAYGTANLMATCARGQEADKAKTGYCYASLSERPLDPIEAAKLASAVYDCAFAAFESFHEDDIGSDLSYLMAVILADPGKKMTYDDCSSKLLAALREGFPPDSPLWNYIATGPLTTAGELDSALARLKELGLIDEVKEN